LKVFFAAIRLDTTPAGMSKSFRNSLQVLRGLEQEIRMTTLTILQDYKITAKINNAN
jgi:hypothetical protein